MRQLLWLVLALVGSVSALLLATYLEIQRRDENALFERYSGSYVRIVDSVDWPSNQTCFEIDVSEHRPGRPVRRIVMISSRGHDQDNWGFSGEFATMRDCVAAFDRG